MQHVITGTYFGRVKFDGKTFRENQMQLALVGLENTLNPNYEAMRSTAANYTCQSVLKACPACGFPPPAAQPVLRKLSLAKVTAKPARRVAPLLEDVRGLILAAREQVARAVDSGLVTLLLAHRTPHPAGQGAPRLAEQEGYSRILNWFAQKSICNPVGNRQIPAAS